MYKFWIIGLVVAMLEGNFLNWWIIKRQNMMINIIFCWHLKATEIKQRIEFAINCW